VSGYDNTNRGTIGRNKRKEQPSHPDFAGSINVDGRDYWLNGWEKENDRGKFLSLSVKPKDGARTSPGERVSRAEPSRVAGLDDDIPFLAEFR